MGLPKTLCIHCLSYRLITFAAWHYDEHNSLRTASPYTYTSRHYTLYRYSLSSFPFSFLRSQFSYLSYLFGRYYITILHYTCQQVYIIFFTLQKVSPYLQDICSKTSNDHTIRHCPSGCSTGSLQKSCFRKLLFSIRTVSC